MAVKSTPRRLRVAVLRCHTILDPIAGERGQFDTVFANWLEAAMKSWNSKHELDKQVVFDVTGWDVIGKNEYPKSLDQIDVLLVTGSAASAYDDEPWVHSLTSFIQKQSLILLSLDVYETHPSIKIFGGCFGHQIIAQSLLGKHDVRVQKNPKGWEVGVHEVAIHPDFAANFATLSQTKAVSMQFLHADSVIYNEGLPPNWFQMGSSSLCSVQGLLQPGRVLTYQGHPEFDSFINKHSVLALANSDRIPESELGEYLALVEKKDDSGLAGELAIEFMLSS